MSLLRLSLLRFARLKLSGKFPMGLGIPPLRIKFLLESKPLKSRILVRRLAVPPTAGPPACLPARPGGARPRRRLRLEGGLSCRSLRGCLGQA